jgi:hypothetical protein
MFHTGVSKIGSPLLSLPLEIRLKIYNYTLDTGVIDPVTNSRVHVVKERRELRDAAHSVRQNNYSLISANAKSGALAQTCTQVRDEMQTYLPKPSFKFVSCYAFEQFIGWNAGCKLNDCNLVALEAAAGVVVVISRPGYGYHSLKHLADMVARPLMVTFIDEKGENSLEQSKAAAIWEEYQKNF